MNTPKQNTQVRQMPPAAALKNKAPPKGKSD